MTLDDYKTFRAAIPALARITGTPIQLWRDLDRSLMIERDRMFYRMMQDRLDAMTKTTIQARLVQEEKNKQLLDEIMKRQKNFLTRNWF